jgi:hypothetical protein
LNGVARRVPFLTMNGENKHATFVAMDIDLVATGAVGALRRPTDLFYRVRVPH